MCAVAHGGEIEVVENFLDARAGGVAGFHSHFNPFGKTFYGLFARFRVIAGFHDIFILAFGVGFVYG